MGLVSRDYSTTTTATTAISSISSTNAATPVFAAGAASAAVSTKREIDHISVQPKAKLPAWVGAAELQVGSDDYSIVPDSVASRTRRGRQRRLFYKTHFAAKTQNLAHSRANGEKLPRKNPSTTEKEPKEDVPILASKVEEEAANNAFKLVSGNLTERSEAEKNGIGLLQSEIMRESGSEAAAKRAKNALGSFTSRPITNKRKRSGALPLPQRENKEEVRYRDRKKRPEARVARGIKLARSSISYLTGDSN